MTGGAFALAGRRVWVAGEHGMVGSALVRRLGREPCALVHLPRGTLDLRRQADVDAWLAANRPDVVILAAARVGGILANDAAPVDFLHDNLMIAANVMAAAHAAGVARLLFLGSSCIYPRLAPQPIPEDALLTGPLEPTNQWYALAKIAGIKLCQAYRRQYGRDFIAAMPTNLYGPGDSFDLATSHVVPALMRKAHEAKAAGAAAITVWGSGRPRREFLHVDDCADALVHILRHHDDDTPINIGCGEDITIADLASLICDVVGYRGRLDFDGSKPDGTPRKLLDVRRLTALGWRPRIDLRGGLAATYQWYRDREAA